MEAYKQKFRKNSKKLGGRKGLNGSDRANEPVKKQDGDYVWLIIRVQACVGDRVGLLCC